MRETYIDNSEDLNALCKQFATAEWLTLDTEFIRETTYYPRLCLIQIADDETAACIDPLAINDLGPLHELLMNTRITKVLHAASQDMEIFYYLWGELPKPVFDTQPAAALAGLGDQIGYANLVHGLTGVELAKGHSRTDWSKRPLDTAQIRYALDDVIHLREVYLKLRDRLRDAGRLEWLTADAFDTLVSTETYRIEPLDIWQRTKGWQKLKGVQLAILQQLAAWREETARKQDRPRGRILKDDLLVEICRRKPRNIDQLGKLRGIDRGFLRRHGEHLVALIEKALALPESDWPRHPRMHIKPTPQQQALADLMQCLVRLKGQQHQIAPASLAARKELEAIASGDRNLSVLKGWKREIVGDALLRLAEGRLQLRVDGQGKVSMQEDQ